MRIACVQSNVAFGDPQQNTCAAMHTLQRLKHEGVDFAVFPEAFLTGYCVSSAEEARDIALRYPDPAHLNTLKQTCDDLNIHAVIGFAEWEIDPADGETVRLYNAAIFYRPGHAPTIYRKTHLPVLGYDRFAEVGNELPVFDTKFGKVGILICFDMRYPEAARTLTMKGADIIVLPTNWPEGAETSAEFISIARAAENHVFMATCNRVGEENGFKFIGRSKIINPVGKVLAEAGADEEVIQADIDLTVARNKTRVLVPGEYETPIISARRPDLYKFEPETDL